MLMEVFDIADREALHLMFSFNQFSVNSVESLDQPVAKINLLLLQ